MYIYIYIYIYRTRVLETVRQNERDGAREIETDMKIKWERGSERSDAMDGRGADAQARLRGATAHTGQRKRGEKSVWVGEGGERGEGKESAQARLRDVTITRGGL
jgi:hypothetical protein